MSKEENAQGRGKGAVKENPASSSQDGVTDGRSNEIDGQEDNGNSSANMPGGDNEGGGADRLLARWQKAEGLAAGGDRVVTRAVVAAGGRAQLGTAQKMF